MLSTESNYLALIPFVFLSQGDTEAWDVQVCDQKIKEATEKARQEAFGEHSLNGHLAVQGCVPFDPSSHFLTYVKTCNFHALPLFKTSQFLVLN